MTTETLERPEILAADEHAEALFRNAFVRTGLAGKRGWRRVKSRHNLPSHSTTGLFIVCTLEDLTREKIAEIRRLKGLKGRGTVFLLLKGKLPSRAVVERIAWLHVKDERRIYYAETDPSGEAALAERLLTTLDSDDEHRILDAWWEDGTFVVVSPCRTGFDRLRVPLEKLPVLSGRPMNQLGRFEIDEDGLFICWPDLDVHLGWEQFQAAVDRQAYLRAKQQSDAFNRAYGAAIRTLRKNSNLRQSDIEGLTTRQVGRIESGLCRATATALTKLAKAHSKSLSDYMNALALLM
jgi:hypothetical protein